MKVHIFGTRGSIPISSPDSVKYGGNTTCLRIESDCVPANYALVVDGGSGYVPLSKQLLQAGIKNIALLLTHYHYDHTQGICLAPHTFVADKIKMWGPREHGIGPKEAMSRIMKSPLFPIEFAMVRQRFHMTPMDDIGAKVLVIHPKGGFHLLAVNTFERAESEGKQFGFETGKYGINQCLVVRMFKTVHPGYTVSYRFEERPTGRVFVFLTDHEKTAVFSQGLVKHLKGADLLIQDCQYSEEVYRTRTAGYGHGTPEYCVDTAFAAGVVDLGLTHHDPSATDADIDLRLAEAIAHWDYSQGTRGRAHKRVFACCDYMIREV